MDVIQRRKALADALSAHDPAAVKGFIHAGFVVRGTDGVITLDCPHLLSQLPEFFKSHPEYKQGVEIESSKIEEHTAMLVTRRTEVFRVLWWSHSVSSRWNETWRKFGGDWMLVEERPVI